MKIIDKIYQEVQNDNYDNVKPLIEFLRSRGDIAEDIDEAWAEEEYEMKTFYVPVTWEEYGLVPIEARSADEAIEIVERDEGGQIPLPTDGDYVDGSFQLAPGPLEEIKAIMDYE